MTEAKTIVLVSTWYYPNLRGGAEHSIQHLAEGLASLGHRVHVLSLHPRRERLDFVHNQVHCTILPPANVSHFLDTSRRQDPVTRLAWHTLDIYNPFAARRLKAELRRIKPDLVQFHNIPGWSMAGWGAAASGSCPVVQVLHDYHFTCPSATRFHKEKNCTRTCLQCAPFAAPRRLGSRSVRYVVANSEYTKQLHLNLGFFTQTRLFKVIYGIVPTPAVPRTGVGEKLRLGYIGRLHPTKGIERIFAALKASGREDLELLIAGRGLPDYEQALKQETSGLKVSFLGYQAASDFLREIDILVVPSIWNEPMGRVVVEAAAFGVPVIGANRGGIPELIRNGVTGWIFEPDSTEGLAGILSSLTPTEILRMQPECTSLGRRFSKEAVIAQWDTFYDELFAAHTKP